MTQLEFEIAEKMFENFKKDLLEQSFEHMSVESFKEEAKVAADVAAKYIRKAYIEGYYEKGDKAGLLADEFLKENGVIE